MLQAMAGYDPGDPASADRPVPDYRAALSGDVKGLRIGLIRHFYENDNPADEATRQGIAAAVKVFEDLGCSVRELRLSPLAEWAACGVIIMLSEAYAIHQATLRERFGDYGEMFRDRMALAALVSGGDYVQAVRHRRELAAEFATAMADFDIAITAATPGEAPAIDDIGKFATFERPMLTMPFNVTGTPAIGLLRLQRGRLAARLPTCRQTVRRDDGAAGRACL
jgi:aspartyl-tRNA(Asn)/glutamyl-tRNA(Gln) amidotransferase subunit A